MLKFFLISFLLLFSLIAPAQKKLNVSVKNVSLTASDSLLPFWFTANQDGKIRNTGSILNLTDLYIGQPLDNPVPGSFAFTWGGNLTAAFGETNEIQLNRLFAGISFRGWQLRGGMFYDSLRYAGLSTTNGNIARSRNARPYPMLRLSTQGYKPLPFLKKWFSFKAEYDEGILNDNRHVDNARLHHKSLYLRLKPGRLWMIQGGMEHIVMWAGTSSDERYGELPKGFNSYFRYILGRSGDENFPLTDQLNVAGNHLGTFQLEVVTYFSKADITFYASHPFEDHSGKNLRNWPDNLLGLYLDFKNKPSLLTGLVYEFTNTRHQSNDDQWDWQGPDSYFNNGPYRSGYTYHQQVMGSPLFFPVIVNNGMARGLRSNRFFAHHMGMCGNLTGYLRWKGMLTFTEHWGTYGNPYNPYQKQLSGLFEMELVHPGFPVELGLSAGADGGNTTDNNFGLQLWLAKRW